MNLFRQIFVGAFCLLVISCSSFAQDEDLSDPLAPKKAPTRIYLGPIGGISKNFHTGGFESFKGDVQCPSFGVGDATGFFAGFSFEYLLGKSPKDSRSSLLVRLAYDSRPASFSVVGDIHPSRLLSTDTTKPEQIVQSSTNHDASIVYQMVNADILYKLNMGNSRFALAAGPSIGLVMKATVDQTFSLVQPNNVQFIEKPGNNYTNNRRTIVLQSGDIPSKSGIRFGVKVGAMYEINASKMLIVPAIWYDFGITKTTSAENWRVNSLMMGVDLRFAL